MIWRASVNGVDLVDRAGKRRWWRSAEAAEGACDDEVQKLAGSARREAGVRYRQGR